MSNIEICKKRVKDHIERVKYFYTILLEDGLIPANDMNVAEVACHDDDKLLKDNLRRQALRFTNNGKMSEEDENEVNNVIREHVKTQKHHCEYWTDGDHLSKGLHCEKMPDKYIYEMMADWASTAEERGTKIIDWYNLCVGKRWFFNEHQKKIMLNCIEHLQKFIEPSRKRDYGKTYIDPAVKKS